MILGQFLLRRFYAIYTGDIDWFSDAGKKYEKATCISSLFGYLVPPRKSEVHSAHTPQELRSQIRLASIVS